MRTIALPRTMSGITGGIKGVGYGTAGGAVLGAFGAVAFGATRDITGYVVIGAILGGVLGALGGMMQRPV